MTHEQKLQHAAELLARKPARMMELILVKAMIGIVDGSVEAMHEEQAKTERLRDALKRVYVELGKGGSAADIYERVSPIINEALKEPT